MTTVNLVNLLVPEIKKFGSAIGFWILFVTLQEIDTSFIKKTVVANVEITR